MLFSWKLRWLERATIPDKTAALSTSPSTTLSSSFLPLSPSVLPWFLPLFPQESVYHHDSGQCLCHRKLKAWRHHLYFLILENPSSWYPWLDPYGQASGVHRQRNYFSVLDSVSLPVWRGGTRRWKVVLFLRSQTPASERQKQEQWFEVPGESFQAGSRRFRIWPSLGTKSPVRFKTREGANPIWGHWILDSCSCPPITERTCTSRRSMVFMYSGGPWPQSSTLRVYSLTPVWQTFLCPH